MDRFSCFCLVFLEYQYKIKNKARATSTCVRILWAIYSFCQFCGKLSFNNKSRTPSIYLRCFYCCFGQHLWNCQARFSSNNCYGFSVVIIVSKIRSSLKANYNDLDLGWIRVFVCFPSVLLHIGYLKLLSADGSKQVTWVVEQWIPLA